jgi:Cu-Zn family superoxide dismutase
VVDPATGETVATLTTPAPPAGSSTFLNDVTVTDDGTIYVTDSQRPVLFRGHATADGVDGLEPWLDLTTGPITYAEGFNLNGIAALVDGSALVTVQSNTGQLWRIDTATGAIAEIAVTGAPAPAPAADPTTSVPPGPFPGGDGLVVDGYHLVVVQNASATLTRLVLQPGATGAAVQTVARDRNLRFPTTAALAGDLLLVVDGQLDQMGPTGAPVLPFSVALVPASLEIEPPIPPTTPLDPATFPLDPPADPDEAAPAG